MSKREHRLTKRDYRLMVEENERVREVGRTETAEKVRRIEQLKEAARLAQEEFLRMVQSFGTRDGHESLKVLGLAPPVTRDEIRTAYRKLARVHHPDVGGNADEFRQIETAYRAALDLNGGK
jgi:DnaJ-class molecular chaperone